jgi:hypothetical protein
MSDQHSDLRDQMIAGSLGRRRRHTKHVCATRDPSPACGQEPFPYDGGSLVPIGDRKPRQAREFPRGRTVQPSSRANSLQALRRSLKTERLVIPQPANAGPAERDRSYGYFTPAIKRLMAGTSITITRPARRETAPAVPNRRGRGMVW